MAGDTSDASIEHQVRELARVLDEERRTALEDRRKNSEARRMIYGYYEDTQDGPKRVPGILERLEIQQSVSNGILDEMRKRDDAWADLKNHIGKIGWDIAKPIIVGLTLLVFVNIMNAVSHTDWSIFTRLSH